MEWRRAQSIAFSGSALNRLVRQDAAGARTAIRSCPLLEELKNELQSKLHLPRRRPRARELAGRHSSTTGRGAAHRVAFASRRQIVENVSALRIGCRSAAQSGVLVRRCNGRSRNHSLAGISHHAFHARAENLRLQNRLRKHNNPNDPKQQTMSLHGLLRFMFRRRSCAMRNSCLSTHDRLGLHLRILSSTQTASAGTA